MRAVAEEEIVVVELLADRAAGKLHDRRGKSLDSLVSAGDKIPQ
jgi:hypothetical protein